jgi:two-component system C4-dicarboxylate transport sensor histidine kinase DctB
MRLIPRSPLILIAICLAGALAMFIVATRMATGIYMAEGQARAVASLGLTIQALDGHLRRFEAIPDLLADQERVLRLVQNPTDTAQVAAMNDWLQARNTALESSDIYIMTPDGVTIAASNHHRPDSFIGQNFTYRPYFTAAMAGQKGRFYAIGTTSGVRGYYFAAPIRDAANATVGVMAAKIGLDVIEAEWRAQDAAIMVTDPEGIVFLSTEADLLYQGILPLTQARLARTTASRRYANIQVTEMSVAQADGVMSINGHEYLAAQRLMPRAGWTVHVLLDTASLRGQARFSALAFLGAVLAVVLLIWQRRARLSERLALQEQTKAELERRVAARTADLARANVLIETEIAERRLTEQELRRTQTDLVQAGKLAALGQMSAALSHEINQPLAAARNYADSAAILIDRGDGLRAKENVVQILSLIDRMAAIARHLRNVARKPDAPLKDIVLRDAVAEAVDILAPRLLQVSVDIPDDLPMVRGGPVRLQQVLVNLLSNAADAMADSADPLIEVTGRLVEGRVLLTLRDHGPGVPGAIADRIFDPFFTTKSVGSGLGLGLSISYNIMKDFGGDLRVANHPVGGAVFTLNLQASATKKETAQ